MRKSTDQRGFSLIELLATVGIAGVVAAITIPSTTQTVADLRLRGDARALHNLVGLAKMRAAARFTRERVFVDLAGETFLLQYWNKTGATWVNEDGVTRLSTGVDFAFGTMASPPPNTQATLAQSSACRNDAGTAIPNTACVVFNSRGIPIDAAGAPTGNTAFYVTDGIGVYAVTLSATPLIRLWWSPARQTSWVHK